MKVKIGRQNIIILFLKQEGREVSFLGIHKSEPDNCIGFSPALHLQCLRRGIHTFQRPPLSELGTYIWRSFLGRLTSTLFSNYHEGAFSLELRDNNRDSMIGRAGGEKRGFISVSVSGLFLFVPDIERGEEHVYLTSLVPFGTLN
jgi:hypothetical protein